MKDRDSEMGKRSDSAIQDTRGGTAKPIHSFSFYHFIGKSQSVKSINFVVFSGREI